MSIHRVAPLSAPTDLALLFSLVGRGTKWLAQRGQGDIIDLFGPLGNSFTPSTEARDLLLVAGGMGIAPLVFLAERGLEAGAGVTLLLGAQTAEQVYPKHSLPPGIKLQVATEDGSIGNRGTVIELLSDFDYGSRQIFACGPVAMYQTLANLIKGQKSIQISMETRMGCGFGGCYGCAIETRSGLRLVCKDGPIFELNDIVW